MTDTPAPTVIIEESRFTSLVDLCTRVNRAKAEFDDAAEEAKSARKAYEAARETFEKEFDRLVRATQGEDLPLFSQQDVLDSANADPVVSKLVDRMLARDLDVNNLVVSGYTEAERNQLSQWLDAMDAFDAAPQDGVEMVKPEMPAFLVPQPLTPVEVASCIERLSAEGVEVDEADVEGWSLRQRAEVTAYLEASARIRAEKGDAVTYDDLPEPPEWLVSPEDDDDEDEAVEGASAEANA